MADEEVLFLSDILPTGYQAVLNTGVSEGGSLAIFGAGPVGQMAAACARMLGVETIFMVDHHQFPWNFHLEFDDRCPAGRDQRCLNIFIDHFATFEVYTIHYFADHME